MTFVGRVLKDEKIKKTNIKKNKEKNNKKDDKLSNLEDEDINK